MSETRGRVLVAGGSGLIGRALVPELAAAGYEAVVLSRRPEAVRGLPAGASAAGWDAATADGWGELADGALAVVNLAGESLASWPWTAEKKRRIRDSRVAASGAVMAAIERAARPPRVLLQGSAVGYYGDRGDAVVTEDDPPGDDFLARTCVEWEAVTAPAEARGVRRVLLRTGVVLATEGGALPQMARPFELFVGGPLGDGRQYVPWIHRADEVAAIRWLLERAEAAGPFDLTAPEPVTNRELSRELARALGRPNLIAAPRLALRLLLGEMGAMVLASLRVVPARLTALGFRFRFPRLDAALTDLYAGR
jgi:hypothetical protein